MFRKLRLVSMLLFLMVLFGSATYSVAHPGVTDVKAHSRPLLVPA